MASFKTSAILILVLLALAAAGVGGAYVYFQIQQRALEQDLALADSYLTQGKAQEADQVLASRLEGASRDAAWLPQALALRLRSLEQLKDEAAQKALAARILDPKAPLVHPGEEAWARAQMILGQAALNAQNIPEAKQRFQALLDQPAATYGRAFATLGLARLEMATSDVSKAHDRLDTVLGSLPENDPARPGIEKALGQCNMAMMMSQQPYGSDQIYVIAKGDTLDGLRKKFKVDPEMLMRINQISDARRLSIGNRIKIPDLDPSLVVNKSDNTLTLLNHGKFFKKYTVRTGAIDFMTPAGDHYTIQVKKIDPTWVNPKDGKTYPPGDPGNQLGSRWMGFQGANLGIHEAIDPTTLGHYSSNGCIGMARDDVQELYDLVPVKTPLKIVGQIVKPAS